MTHPTETDLQRWYDGDGDEVRAPASPIAAHVASCERCAGRVAALEALSTALRCWADAPPASAEASFDVADAVLAQLGLAGTNGVALAPPEAALVPAATSTADAAAEAVAAASAAPDERSAAVSEASAAATVLPLPSRGRRWRAALWPTLAVAAAIGLSFAVRPSLPTGDGDGADAGSAASSHAGAAGATPRGAGGLAAGASAAPLGEVLGVRGDALRLYAVLEVTDEQSGRALPVVWLEDDGFKRKAPEGKLQ